MSRIKLCAEQGDGISRLMGTQWFWKSGENGFFIFWELWSTGDYFPGFGEQAHSFGDLGSPAKKFKKKLKTHLKGKAFILFDFFLKKNIFGFSRPLLANLNVLTFVLKC